MKIVHHGSARTGAALVEALEQEGLTVKWEPPVTFRGIGTDVHEIVVQVVAAGAAMGMTAAVRTAVARFKQRFPGSDAEVDPGSGSATEPET